MHCQCVIHSSSNETAQTVSLLQLAQNTQFIIPLTRSKKPIVFPEIISSVSCHITLQSDKYFSKTYSLGLPGERTERNVFKADY